MTNAPQGRDGFVLLSGLIVIHLLVAVRVVKDQIGKLEILVLAVPVMQYTFLIILDHLLTNRADSILHSVYSCHESGCYGLNLLFIAILKVLIPPWIEGIGRPFYFDMPLLFDQLSNLDQTCACVGVGKSPAF